MTVGFVGLRGRVGRRMLAPRGRLGRRILWLVDLDGLVPFIAGRQMVKGLFDVVWMAHAPTLGGSIRLAQGVENGAIV